MLVITVLRDFYVAIDVGIVRYYGRFRVWSMVYTNDLGNTEKSAYKSLAENVTATVRWAELDYLSRR